MALYAVEDIGDAIEATRAFLLPFDRSRWLRLAVVAFFVAGGVGTSAPFNAGGSVDSPGDGTTTDLPSVDAVVEQLPGDVLALAVGIAVLLLLLWLVLGVVSAIMEFALVESLRSDAVHVRRYARRYGWQGVRLFAFRVGVTLLGLAALALVGWAVVSSTIGFTPSAWDPAGVFGVVLVLLPVLFVVFALVSLVNGFTTAFVVPVMLLEDRTVLGGWRRFWPTLRGQLTQYGAYVVMGIVIAIAFGIIGAMVTGVGAVVLAIPFAVVGLVAFVLAGGTMSVAALAVPAVLAVVYLALLLVLMALVQVPLQTFLRYYTLLILGDTNEAFDVVPEQRTAVRE